MNKLQHIKNGKETAKSSPYYDIKENLTQIFSKDLTADISQKYIDRICDSYGLCESSSIDHIQQSLYQCYFEMGHELFGPMFIDFVFNTLKNYNNSGKIFFLERDGIIFYDIARELIKVKKLGIQVNENQLDLLVLTRRFLGIEDEIAHYDQKDLGKTNNQKAQSYLNHKGVNSNSLLVDTGCYGTIIEHLYKNFYNQDATRMPGSVFLVSKNPYITGYLNQVGGLTDKERSIILDAVECQIPKEYESPDIKQLKQIGNDFSIDYQYIDYKHNIGKYLLAGMNDGIRTRIGSILNSEQLFDKNDLNQLQRKKPHLIINTTTPTWSMKDEFLTRREKSGIGKINNQLVDGKYT